IGAYRPRVTRARRFSAVCGRFTLTTPPSVLARELEVEVPPDLAPRYNAAPGQDVATVWRRAGGPRALRQRRWGLVPLWARDPRTRPGAARPAPGPAARPPPSGAGLRLPPCLAPADGFYEWAASGRGPRQPYHIAFADQTVFAIAGLFERWRAEDGSWLES